jgi:hypothetical protein
MAIDVGPLHLENFVRSQPFVDVRVETFSMPVGVWPLGTFHLALESIPDWLKI